MSRLFRFTLSQQPSHFVSLSAVLHFQLSLSAKFKLNELTALFAHVHSALVRSEFLAHNQSFVAARDSLKTKYGVALRKPSASAPAPASAPATKKPKPGSVVDVSGSSASSAASMSAWLSTGRSVSALYEQYRAEAADHARRRNALFAASTDAFLKGNTALAKQLSVQVCAHFS
jgi:hypothetical protein